MRRALAGIGAAMACCATTGALLVSSAGAQLAAAAVTCTATGNGTSYALSITLRTGIPSEGALAFGDPDASVTNISIDGTDGTLATSGLPRHTSAAWVFNAGVARGTLTADLTTTSVVTHPFTVYPSLKKSKYLGGVRCPLHAPALGNSFVPATIETYLPGSKTWTEVVSVPGPGVVSFGQTSKPLVAGGKATAHGPGTVTLTLAPTAAGKAELAAKGVLYFTLKITYAPIGGKPASKLAVMVLRVP